MEKIKTMLKLLYQSTLIPAYIYHNETLVEMFPDYAGNTPPFTGYLNSLLAADKKVGYLSTSFYGYYGAMKVNQLADTVIIAGPVSQIPYSKDTFRIMKKECLVPKEREQSFDAFFNAIPPMQLQQFIHHLITIHYFINKEEIKFTELFQLTTQTPEINEKQAVNVYEKKENNYFNNSYEVETQMLKNVELGNEAGLLRFINEPFITHEGVLANNSIRQAKNTYIVTITLITRAAIRGGLETEVAFQLSDLYIQQIEKLSTLEAIQTLCQEALFNFTKRVAEVRYSVSKDEDIYRMTQYVYKNTNKSITVNDIAAHFGYSRTYLSHKFKKESGMNLSHFITMCKLEEAKILLKRTNKPISEISNFLCFSSQSHFQTAFKKHCGCTPASFRKKK
ncbi:YSIRK-targeted surface antigen transcriptional regulator [Evansella caseinilytica]|uniref:YSIRK-targeted surface antigen transcriptional regulator n=1 Tax=Evansella caseinilytica TaxID=1503961 RepID=A0A1H3U4J6_9BACI|nr:helix-turn-helix domain-containing protein [Evansella caseinilytica]SDZ57282.1 YSIRK-targeted surface antigen transcriptional regulator [Evansella caseinilytica]